MLHTSIQSIEEVKKRIVSLVPSITELLYDLGLDEEVLGITKFCVHPHHWFQKKSIVGGTKNLRLSAIENLKPDLIIASKEENIKEQIEALGKHHDVLLTDVISIEDGFQLIKDIGIVSDTIDTAVPLLQKTKLAFNNLAEFIGKKSSRSKVAYLIWQEPYMTVGGDTFIQHMLTAAGFINSFESCDRYPTTSISDLEQLNLDYIFLSSEPFPFNTAHKNDLEILLPNSKIVLVDGEMFSWYGSRMLKFPNYIIEKLQLL